MPPFVNWARTVRTTPTTWAAPASEDEVVKLVHDVRARGGRLRVSGARHSWSPIAGSDDVQVELTRMDRVLSIDRDAERSPCWVAVACTRSARPSPPPASRCPSWGPSPSRRSAAPSPPARTGRACGTATSPRWCAGCGWWTARVRSTCCVTATRTWTRRGYTSACSAWSRRSPSPASPRSGLVETSLNLPFDEACDRMTELADGHEYVKLWWLPPLDQVLVRTYAAPHPTCSAGAPRRGARWSATTCCSRCCSAPGGWCRRSSRTSTAPCSPRTSRPAPAGARARRCSACACRRATARRRWRCRWRRGRTCSAGCATSCSARACASTSSRRCGSCRATPAGCRPAFGRDTVQLGVVRHVQPRHSPRVRGAAPAGGPARRPPALGQGAAGRHRPAHPLAARGGVPHARRHARSRGRVSHARPGLALGR